MRHRLEGLDDAEHGAEQSHQRGGRGGQAEEGQEAVEPSA